MNILNLDMQRPSHMIPYLIKRNFMKTLCAEQNDLQNLNQRSNSTTSPMWTCKRGVRALF